MKPSQRIMEIHKSLIEQNPIAELMNIGGASDSAIKAISIYLDEEWEKKQDKGGL